MVVLIIQAYLGYKTSISKNVGFGKKISGNRSTFQVFVAV
jgi:hypothetical protein